MGSNPSRKNSTTGHCSPDRGNIFISGIEGAPGDGKHLRP